MRKQTTLWLNSTYVVVSLMHISPVTGAFRETTERNKLLVDATGCLVRQGESVWRMLRSWNFDKLMKLGMQTLQVKEIETGRVYLCSCAYQLTYKYMQLYVTMKS